MSRPAPPSPSQRARAAAELIGAGQHKTAERILKDVLRSDPGQLDALVALGCLAGMQGNAAEAVKHLRRAVRSGPRSPEAHLNLGQALMQLGRPAEAAEAFARAAGIADSAVANEKLGDCLRQLDRLEEAAPRYLRAAELDPDNPLALSSAVETLRKLCDWRGLGDLESRLLDHIRAGRPVEPLLAMHVTDDPRLQRQAAAAYWREMVAPRAPPPSLAAPRSAARGATTGSRIRLGYLSPDFRRHPMVSVIAEAIALHDRTRFEVVGWSCGADDGSPERKLMQQAFDRFQDVSGLSEAQLARRIAEAGTDILIDLAGYTANARLGTVAARPAPVVCHYMGFPGTLGGRAYDYLIADRVVMPDEALEHVSEAVVRLPSCYWALDHRRPRPAGAAGLRRDHGLPDDAVVLASFNGQQKLTPALLGVWARILTAAPATVLWLYTDRPSAAANLGREAEARGIPPHRLITAGRVPPAQHLARLAHADLMLDCFPYGGHTTACDALWLGVPVLTLAGRAFASRVGASLLTAAGLPELITTSLEDYERQAVALAGDGARRAGLQARLGALASAGTFLPTARFVRDLETAFQTMLDRHRKGEPPTRLDVPAAGELDPNDSATG